jgi:hypothetical protein
MNDISQHKKIMNVIGGLSILIFPVMLLIGFLLHPDLTSFEMVRTPEQLVKNFRGNCEG